MNQSVTVADVKRGDIVEFSGFALRVESDPIRKGNFVTLRGRISTDGCPLVSRGYIYTMPVVVRK